MKDNNEYVKKSDQKSELNRYATKSYVLTCGGLLVIAVYSAYWLITPIMIKSEINQFTNKIEEMLRILKSNKNKK